jgi:hypothetical protein
MEGKCMTKLNRYSVWGIKRSSERNKINGEFYLTDSEEENEKWGNKFGEIERDSSDDENTKEGNPEKPKQEMFAYPVETINSDEPVDLKKISSDLLEIARQLYNSKINLIGGKSEEKKD